MKGAAVKVVKTVRLDDAVESIRLLNHATKRILLTLRQIHPAPNVFEMVSRVQSLVQQVELLCGRVE
jgi:hypothetical protein